MKRGAVAAAGLALLLLAGCGRGGEQRSDQPTAEENEKLDGIAGKVEQEQDGTTTFDTSPDSKIPVEAPSGGNNQAAAPANGAAPANVAQPAVSANAAAPN